MRVWVVGVSTVVGVLAAWLGWFLWVLPQKFPGNMWWIMIAGAVVAFLLALGAVTAPSQRADTSS